MIGGFFVANTPQVLADDTGFLVPTTNTTGTPNSNNWTNPANGYASDDTYTTAGSSGRWVSYANFNIPVIPAGYTIDGIEVTIEGLTTGRQAEVNLSWNGINYTTGDGTGVQTTAFTGIETTDTLGGATNKWGTSHTWTAVDFTNANFRARLTSISGSNTISVDQVRVKVYYSDTTAPIIAAHSNVVVSANALGGATVTYTNPTATDNVDPSVTVTCAPASGSFFSLGATTVTCNTQDAAGNSATPTTFTVTVNPDSVSASVSMVVVSNNFVNTSGGVTTITITAKDQYGNPISGIVPSNINFSITGINNTLTPQTTPTNSAGIFTATLQSTTPQTKIITVTINSTELSQKPSVDFYTSNPAKANITATPATQEASLSGTTINLDILITDGYDNPVPNGNAIWVVPSTTAPQGTPVSSCTFASQVLTSGGHVSCSINFNYKGDVILQVYSIASGILTGSGNTTIHFTDTTKPIIAFHGDETAEATSHFGATVIYTNPTATDNIDGTVSVACLPASGSTFTLGNTIVTCTASDSVPNTETSTFTVHVIDTTKPTITAPADITKEATAEYTPVNLGTPVVSDIADPAPTVTKDAPTTFSLGETIVTWTATDHSGNSQTATQKVTITDLTKPIIDSHENISGVEATSPAGAVVTYTAPTSHDLVDGDLPSVCALPSGSTFPIGVTTVTCNKTDVHNNVADPVTFTVTVTDTIAPTMQLITPVDGALVKGAQDFVFDFADVNLLQQLELDVIGPAPYNTSPSRIQVTFPAGATDPSDLPMMACMGVGVVYSDVDQKWTVSVDTAKTWNASTCGSNPYGIPDGGKVYPDGTYDWYIQVNDIAGNHWGDMYAPTPEATRHWKFDNLAPVIIAPVDQTFEATGPLTTPVLTPATATDIVDSSVDITYAPHNFPVGETTVTWTATDDSGNTSTATSNVTIIDSTPPVITAPIDQTFEAIGPLTTPTLVPATATDIADPSVDITYTPHDFPVGADQVVTWTATDDSGKTSTVTSKVTIKDTTKPTIDTHVNITIEATSAAGAVAEYTAPMSHDLVDGDLLSICSPVSGSTFPLGVTTVTCSKTDANSNVATPVTFTITVQDKTAPAISFHLDITAEATSPSGVTVTYDLPTATDIVDVTDTVICSPVSGSTFPLGTTVVNCTATDAHGNIGTSNFNVIVQDTTKPTIENTPSDMIVVANATGGATVTYTNPNATDLVDITDPVTCAPLSGSFFPLGETTVTCNSQDEAGNDATPTTFTVTVVPDTIAKLTVSATSPKTTAENSTITIKGRDQYNNITTNQSGTVVVVSVDNGGVISNPLVTLTNGVGETSLTKSVAGTVNVTVSSGSLTPATTQVVFTPADTTGPSVTDVYPAKDAIDISINAPLFFTTNESLKQTTVNSSNVQLWKTGAPAQQVSAVVSLVEGGQRVNIVPDGSLEYSASYYFVITAGVTDEAGNALANPKDSSSTGFTTAANTADLTPPTVIEISQYPAPSATGVALTVQPSVDFSETIDVTTLTFANVKLIKDSSDGSEVLTTVVVGNGATRAIIQPTSPLEQNTAYHISVTTGVKDVAGNPLAADYTGGSFTTIQVPPVVVDEIIAQNNFVVADGTYINGWHYIFRITVNTDETDMYVKFSDWINSADEGQTVEVNGNTRLLFNTAGGGIGAGVGLTNDNIENGYGDTVKSYALGNEYEDQTLEDVASAIDISNVDNTTDPGRQIQFDVFTKIPTDTAPGFYTTTYGIEVSN